MDIAQRRRYRLLQTVPSVYTDAVYRDCASVRRKLTVHGPVAGRNGFAMGTCGAAGAKRTRSRTGGKKTGQNGLALTSKGVGELSWVLKINRGGPGPVCEPVR